MKGVANDLFQSEVSILLSLEGCMEQRAHRDFPLHNSNCKQSYLAIVAVMPTTKVIGYNQGAHQVINLNLGDALIARGDFVHNGAGYSKLNCRLHWYFDKPNNGRELNKTYFVDYGLIKINSLSCQKDFKNLSIAQEKRKKRKRTH